MIILLIASGRIESQNYHDIEDTLDIAGFYKAMISTIHVCIIIDLCGGLSRTKKVLCSLI